MTLEKRRISESRGRGTTRARRLSAVRALVAIAVSFTTGLLGPALVAAVPRPAWWAVAGLSIGLAAAALARAGRPRWIVAALSAAAFAAGASTASGASRDAPLVPEGVATVEGFVDTVRHGRDGPSAIVVVVRGRRVEDRAPIPPRARVLVRGAKLPPGARVRVLLRLTARVLFRNPTPHPDWPAAAPIAATARVPRGARAHVVERSVVREHLEHARTSVRHALDRTLDDRARGLARALVLGEGEAVDEDSRAAVRDSGLSHVLAVSGLHVALLAGALVTGVRRALLFVPALAARVDASRVASALGIPIALAYAAFAGGAPSAWRAAITASIAWSIVAIGRRPRGPAIVAAAAIVLGAASPADAVRPAFLLSIVATAAIVSAPRLGAKEPVDTLRSAVVVSTRTTIATAPLVVWCFGAVPLVGVLANVVLVPIGALLLLPLASIHAALALAAPLAARLTAPLVDATAAAFVSACTVFAETPIGRDLPPPSVSEGIVIAVTAVALLVARRWRARLAWIVAAILALGAGEIALRIDERPVGEVRVTFLDVGQGDAALVDLPDGRLMLVDAGGGLPDPGARAVVPLLRARRRDAIDVAVISHPHPDHYGGVAAIAEAVPIRELWDAGVTTDADRGAAATLLAALRARGTIVRTPHDLCGAPRRFGRATIETLWPCPRADPTLGANDNSLVLRVAIGKRAILLTGDIEREAERTLLALARDRLRADVLKVPHHGSRTSSDAALLDAIDPRLAVVSCGRTNRFGHPHREVLARYADRAIDVLRTDRHGGVIVTTDGSSLRASAWSGAEWP